MQMAIKKNQCEEIIGSKIAEVTEHTEYKICKSQFVFNTTFRFVRALK